MKLHELQEARSRTIAKMRALTDKAETETRDLSDAENTEFGTLKDEVRALDGKIDRAGLRETGIIATRQLAKRQITWLRAMPASMRMRAAIRPVRPEPPLQWMASARPPPSRVTSTLKLSLRRTERTQSTSRLTP